MFFKTEQEKRKAKSINILKERKVPFIELLPCIEGENEASFRTKEEVAERAICLALVAAYAEGLEKSILEEKAEEFKVQDAFTDDEKAFFAMEEIDDLTKAKFLWRYESLWVLLWALSYVETLEFPTEICDVPFAVQTVVKRGREKFISDAKLRSKAEILDEADLIYRLHWATTETRIHGDEMPADLDGDTVFERHYALNWLICYGNDDWDNVETNT